jgi:hypothetical protein
VNPVVVRCPFEWLAGVDGPIHLLLFLLVVLGSLDHSLALHPVALALFLRLLFLRWLGWPDEILLNAFYRAQNTLVVLKRKHR